MGAICESKLNLVPKYAKEYGIKCKTINTTFRIKQKLMTLLSEKRKHIFALCSDSILANDLISVCSELGIRYQDDINIISLFQTETTTKVPHVAIDSYSIGRKAAKLALDILSRQTPESKTLIVPPTFKVPERQILD